MPSLLSVQHRPEHVELHWSDGRHSRMPAMWMRDNVPQARHRPEGQKLFDISTIPEDVRIRDAAVTPAGLLRVRFEPEGMDAQFDPDWLLRYCAREEHENTVHWDAGLTPLPRASWSAISSSADVLARWLHAVVTHGFALLHGLRTEHGALLDVVSLFDYVRETNYGRLFDVITEPSPANLANAGVGLGLHTDNPYRDPVPTLQLLHCLVASESGGESVICDGLRVATRLREQHPEDFSLLADNPVRFRYVDTAVDLECRAPMIETDAAGTIRGVRYNNRSLAPLELDPALLPAYYRAYRRFSALLHEPAAAVSFRLAPGDLFIVDNRRVLHGRGAFAPGRRHLQGCYADMDSLRSTLRCLQRRQSE